MEPETDQESLLLIVGMWGMEEQPTEGTVDLSIFCDTPALPATLVLPGRKVYMMEAGDKSLSSDAWDSQRVPLIRAMQGVV